MSSKSFSRLALVNLVDTWPYYQQNPAAYKARVQDYYYFMIEGYPKPFGYIEQRLLTMEGAPTSPREFYNEALRVMSSEGEHVLNTDRSGLDPFGFVSFSTHLIGFVREGNDTKYWVPKRSATKPTVPNKLDSTVAGVIRSGERPVDCMARKIAVEASVPKEYTRANITACGTVLYQMSITSTGKPSC
ncbi:Thiamine pyrophosphokinase [Madurella mycetomatis]|uniref:Thiamine pyrophosphokinase n=1 Tax=Madurella mycetomatis TaxID=100816 RepID=A0A175VQ77_9PEZI|nr:Thiamine pyrophosphokinase [Madurella mycetomatis]